jgi:hypothetical protein
MTHQPIIKLANELFDSALIDTTLAGLVSQTVWRWVRRYWPKRRRTVRKPRRRR